MIKNDKNFYDKTLKYTFDILFLITLILSGLFLTDLYITVAILTVGMMINTWLYKIYEELKKKKDDKN